jgi:hypothetical protein
VTNVADSRFPLIEICTRQPPGLFTIDAICSALAGKNSDYTMNGEMTGKIWGRRNQQLVLFYGILRNPALTKIGRKAFKYMARGDLMRFPKNGDGPANRNRTCI